MKLIWFFVIAILFVSLACAEPPPLPTAISGKVLGESGVYVSNALVEASWEDGEELHQVQTLTLAGSDSPGEYFFIRGEISAPTGTPILIRSRGESVSVNARPGEKVEASPIIVPVSGTLGGGTQRGTMSAPGPISRFFRSLLQSLGIEKVSEKDSSEGNAGVDGSGAGNSGTGAVNEAARDGSGKGNGKESSSTGDGKSDSLGERKTTFLPSSIPNRNTQLGNIYDPDDSNNGKSISGAQSGEGTNDTGRGSFPTPPSQKKLPDEKVSKIEPLADNDKESLIESSFFHLFKPRNSSFEQQERFSVFSESREPIVKEIFFSIGLIGAVLLLLWGVWKLVKSFMDAHRRKMSSGIERISVKQGFRSKIFEVETGDSIYDVIDSFVHNSAAAIIVSDDYSNKGIIMKEDVVSAALRFSPKEFEKIGLDKIMRKEYSSSTKGESLGDLMKLFRKSKEKIVILTSGEKAIDIVDAFYFLNIFNKQSSFIENPPLLREVIDTRINTLDFNAKAYEAAKVLVSNQSSCVLILKNAKIAGIVTLKDILNCLDKRFDLRKINVSAIMSPNVFTAKPGDDMPHFFSKLIEDRFNQIPLMEEGKIIGIANVADIAISYFDAEKEAYRV